MIWEGGSRNRGTSITPIHHRPYLVTSQFGTLVWGNPHRVKLGKEMDHDVDFKVMQRIASVPGGIKKCSAGKLYRLQSPKQKHVCRHRSLGIVGDRWIEALGSVLYWIWGKGFVL